MGKVKIGVVGCGYLGKFHAEKYFTNPRHIEVQVLSGKNRTVHLLSLIHI